MGVVYRGGGCELFFLGCLFLEAGRPQVRAHLLKVILVTLARTFEAHASLAVEAVHVAVDRVHCGVRRMAAFEDVRLLDFVEARRDDSGEADEEQQEETREQSDTEHDVAGDDCPFDPIGAVILDRNLHLVVRVEEAMEVLSTRELLAELARMVEVGKRTELYVTTECGIVHLPRRPLDSGGVPRCRVINVIFGIHCHVELDEIINGVVVATVAARRQRATHGHVASWSVLEIPDTLGSNGVIINGSKFVVRLRERLNLGQGREIERFELGVGEHITKLAKL
mmetsp:Transcript_36201/g.96862  ORF Transcript_36201/g.96862 Transcript_36201/m.96862 type:complete len:282 (-) Transcript_36201:469-1314(-)